MVKKIYSILDGLSNLLLGEKDSLGTGKNVPDDAVLLEKARLDWQAAHSFFNYVSDEKQIDQAIFNLIAAEKYYGYLLQKIRMEHRHNRKVEKGCE